MNLLRNIGAKTGLANMRMGSLLFPKQTASNESVGMSNWDPMETSVRTAYTFYISDKLIRYRRATRPKKTNDNSVQLNYEQAQFAEKIGVTKSWNSWNTCIFFSIRKFN